MIKVVIIGAGNLAFHLTNEMLQQTANIQLVQVYNRNIKKIEYLASKVAITNSLHKLKQADIYIVCVADNAIAEVSKQLNFPSKLVVHTSGANSVNILQSNSYKGVFYPLQTFSTAKNINFSNVPFCIETENSKQLNLLSTLAKTISNKVYFFNAEQRKALHVSAVFVNNFVNHLFHIGNQICTSNNIPFEILKPIIDETVQKIETLTPFDAQTGPAKRNDTKTIEEHLAILTANQQEIYKLLTNSITKTYGKKL
jgi:predicted short-subunit dehydrogenase-like oxidoreductase (DUF2520 family)